MYKIPLLKIYSLKTKNFSLGISLTGKISQMTEGYHHTLVLHTHKSYALQHNDFSGPQNVTSEQYSLRTGWKRTNHHTTFSFKLIRQQTNGCHYPLQSREVHCYSKHNSHKTLWPDNKRFLHSPPTFLTAANCRWKANLYICHPFRTINKHTTRKTASCTQCSDDNHSLPVNQLVTHPTIFRTSGTTVFLLWLS